MSRILAILSILLASTAWAGPNVFPGSGGGIQTIADATDTNITSPGDGSLFLYDTGTGKWIDNVMSGDCTLLDTGAIDCTSIGWTALNTYPTGCTNQCVTAIDDTLTCSSITTNFITDGTITEADLKAVDSAVDEECLTYETTTGDFEWQACGSGSSIILDLGDDEGDDSTGLEEISTSGDTNSIFTFSTAEGVDELNINAANNWPSADTADALSTNPSPCGAGDFVTDMDADGTLTCGTPSGSGDVTDVGPACATGACFTDSVVTTGTRLITWEGTTSNTLEYAIEMPEADPTADYVATFPAGTGTLALTANADGGITESDISDLDHTATAITDGLIIEPDLNADNSPSDGDILTYDSTGTNFAWITPNAGTNITADLEEETHASEHSLGGGDAITVTNLASGCTDGQVLGGTSGGTGVECQADVDTDTTLSQEQVEDYAGALIGDGTGTHAGITFTYQDSTGDIDVDVTSADCVDSDDDGNCEVSWTSPLVQIDANDDGTLDTSLHYDGLINYLNMWSDGEADQGLSLQVDNLTSGASDDSSVTFYGRDGGANVAFLSWVGNGATANDRLVFPTGSISGTEILDDTVVLTTDTAGNYVATIADAGNSTITVSGSGSEGAAVTLDAVDVNCTGCLGGTEIAGLTTADLTNSVIIQADNAGTDQAVTLDFDSGFASFTCAANECDFTAGADMMTTSTPVALAQFPTVVAGDNDQACHGLDSDFCCQYDETTDNREECSGADIAFNQDVIVLTGNVINAQDASLEIPNGMATLPTTQGYIALETDHAPQKMASIGDGTEAKPIRTCWHAFIQETANITAAQGCSVRECSGFAKLEYMKVPVDVTISDLECEMMWADVNNTEDMVFTVYTATGKEDDASPTDGEALTLTGEAASSVTCTITGAATAEEWQCSDHTHSVSIEQGQLWQIRFNSTTGFPPDTRSSCTVFVCADDY